MNFLCLPESFHKLNEPLSGSYPIFVWTGLFVSVFERAHESTESMNEPMSVSCDSGPPGYFQKQKWYGWVFS